MTDEKGLLPFWQEYWSGGVSMHSCVKGSVLEYHQQKETGMIFPCDLFYSIIITNIRIVSSYLCYVKNQFDSMDVI